MAKSPMNARAVLQTILGPLALLVMTLVSVTTVGCADWETSVPVAEQGAQGTRMTQTAATTGYEGLSPGLSHVVTPGYPLRLGNAQATRSDANDEVSVVEGTSPATLDRLGVTLLDNYLYLPFALMQRPPRFYVSRTGDNTDGRSWTTAWNELDQIAWELVRPGSVVTIAGGEYHTRMAVGASGVPSDWITITTDGNQVVMDGLRPAPPYCGQVDYTPVPGDDAVELDGQGYIIIDGRDWRGIVVRNHARGIRLREGAHNIVVRNVEVYNNGWSIGSGADREPDGPGVELGGSNILFERVIIHDNGQDAFQSGWGVWNFTLRQSWLYNSREHPNRSGVSFNYCSHTDGIQIYGDYVQGPFAVQDSIIGPSFTQGIIISAVSNVDNVLVDNTLFVGNANAGIVISAGGTSSNWMIRNATIVQSPTEDSWNVRMEGYGHQVRDSVFWGGPWGIGIFDWTDASGNINWLTPDRYGIAIELDPMFIDDDYLLVGESFADFDFMMQNPEIPPQTGCSITAVAQLLGQLTETPVSTSQAYADRSCQSTRR